MLETTDTLLTHKKLSTIRKAEDSNTSDYADIPDIAAIIATSNGGKINMNTTATVSHFVKMLKTQPARKDSQQQQPKKAIKYQRILVAKELPSDECR